jgi:probable rRNA maturation factor
LRAELTIEVRGRARRAVKPATLATLRRLVGRAMRAAGVAERALALSLSDDDELLALNRQFAGEDHATDVLSFEQEAPLLGDVIISVETATRQAEAAGHGLVAELVHLAVHGVVHLLGFDHATKAEERVMFGFEARLRAAARAAGPVVRVRAPARGGAAAKAAAGRATKAAAERATKAAAAAGRATKAAAAGRAAATGRRRRRA